MPLPNGCHPPALEQTGPGIDHREIPFVLELDIGWESKFAPLIALQELLDFSEDIVTICPGPYLSLDGHGLLSNSIRDDILRREGHRVIQLGKVVFIDSG